MSGMRGVNPRQMKQAMKKMGITNTDVKGVTEVVIRTHDEEIVIRGAQVSCMEVQGTKNYQITGTEERRPLGSEVPAAAHFPEEDIELVMAQAGCDREAAVSALKACEGQPAEAIIRIISG
ncbi:MAG: nascent polypeptide-associated complex protein [Candidatus Methanomethylophilaceae archaeon]|nr:nascent polypeptide-associated complex protein [Candidatus Methanomethylophilaceae archaeon]